MSRARPWPQGLDVLLDEPVVPHCPEACPFRELCPTHTQEGISKLFRSTPGYTKPQDCLWWERLAALVRRDLGIEPPATAAELRAAMGELRHRPAPEGAGDAWEGS